MKITAIIPASGKGKRMQSEQAKQYIELCSKPLLFHTVKAFEESDVDEIVLVVPGGDEEFVRTTIVDSGKFRKVKQIIAGGDERYHSVYHGLLAAGGSDYVLIHDGARPLVDGELIMRCIDEVKKTKACVAAVPVKDTIKEADEEARVTKTPDRSKLWTIQTPQCFSYSLILSAYESMFRAAKEGTFSLQQITDDASVLERMTEHPVKLVLGDYRNLKVTTPEDIVLAEALLKVRVTKTV